MAGAVVQALGVRSVGAVTSITSSAFTASDGNQLVVGWVTSPLTGPTPGTVSGSVSQAWAQDAPARSNSSNTRVGLAQALNITGGSQTVTVTPGVSAYVSLAVIENSGVESSEETVSATGNGATPSPGVLTPTSSGDLYVAVGSDEQPNGPVTTANASNEGWTMQYQSDDRVNMPIYLQTIAATSGAKTGSFATSPAVSVWVVCAAAFRATDVPAPLQRLDSEGMSAGRY